jgi:protein TonB
VSHAQPLHIPAATGGATAALGAGRQPWGLMLVVGLHALLGWALMDSLGPRVADAARPPVVARFVPDPQTPPPPPPQPDLPRPKALPPQQTYAPLPELPPNAAQEPAITTQQDAALPTAPWADTAAATSQASASLPTAPRMAARPAIANVRACAPTGDDYPPTARRAEATGTTRLRFTIDAAGALARSEIVRSAGPTREHRLLDKVAENRLAGCAFTAGMDETGKAVGGTFEVDYVWRLE